MKRMMIAAMLVGSLLLTGCQGGGGQAGTSPQKPAKVENYYSLIGEDKATVDQAVDFGDTEPEVTDSGQETYTFSGGWGVDLKLVFHENHFIAYEYEFESTEDAYEHAVQLRADLGNYFGTETTYPGLGSQFDNLTGFEAVEEQRTYIEDWTLAGVEAHMKNYPGWIPVFNEEKTKRIVGDQPYSRIDLRFQLATYPEDKATVSVACQIVP